MKLVDGARWIFNYVILAFLFHFITPPHISFEALLKAGRLVNFLDFLIYPILSATVIILGSTHPLTEMSTRNLPGGKGHLLTCKADNLAAVCELYKSLRPVTVLLDKRRNKCEAWCLRGCGVYTYLHGRSPCAPLRYADDDSLPNDFRSQNIHRSSKVLTAAEPFLTHRIIPGSFPGIPCFVYDGRMAQGRDILVHFVLRYSGITPTMMDSYLSSGLVPYAPLRPLPNTSVSGTSRTIKYTLIFLFYFEECNILKRDSLCSDVICLCPGNCMLHIGYCLDLFFDHEDGIRNFLRNIGEFLVHYTELQPRR
jgi:hypothetical protein